MEEDCGGHMLTRVYFDLPWGSSQDEEAVKWGSGVYWFVCIKDGIFIIRDVPDIRPGIRYPVGSGILYQYKTARNG